MATGTNNKPDAPNNQENAGQGISRPASSTTSRPSTNRSAAPMAGQPGMDTNPPEAISSAIDDVSGKAKEAVDRASESLKQTSASASMQMQQMQQTMRDRAYDVKSNAAHQLYQAAATIRNEVHTSQGERIDQAEALAQSLEDLGRYLDDHSFEQIESDLRHTIQRNPWQSVGAGFAAGWVLGRMFKH